MNGYPTPHPRSAKAVFQGLGSTEAVCKHAEYLCITAFSGLWTYTTGRDTTVITQLALSDESDVEGLRPYVLIAAISASVPRILMAR